MVVVTTPKHLGELLHLPKFVWGTNSYIIVRCVHIIYHVYWYYPDHWWKYPNQNSQVGITFTKLMLTPCNARAGLAANTNSPLNDPTQSTLTCTARLKKVPASAASLLTLKSMIGLVQYKNKRSCWFVGIIRPFRHPMSLKPLSAGGVPPPSCWSRTALPDRIGNCRPNYRLKTAQSGNTDSDRDPTAGRLLSAPPR